MVFPFWLRQVDSRSFLGWQLGQTKDEELSFRSPDLGMPPSIHVERLFLMGGLFSVAFLRWSKVLGRNKSENFFARGRQSTINRDQWPTDSLCDFSGATDICQCVVNTQAGI